MKVASSILKLALVASSLAVMPVTAKDKTAAGFQAYLSELQQEAVTRGIDPALLDKAFATIEFRPTVVKSDKNQPERKITLDDYLATRVPDWKVNQAVEKLSAHRGVLEEIADVYQVQPRFIVALWGNESNFGRIQGKFDVLSALSSLAYEGRRETLFRKQFFAALTILNEGHIELADFKGSWAGAMGQSQFMPTSFLTYAVDYNKDGKKDIWGTPADVFASIANFLSSEGWQGDYTWGRQVTLTSDEALSKRGLDKQHYQPLAAWQQLGVRRYDGSALPDVDIRASLIMPDGPDGRIYLVYNNFHTLMKWNRSSYFGVSVGYLSDRIKRGY
ncbi:lytic murein transglycosylase [Alteromonas salexigens]